MIVKGDTVKHKVVTPKCRERLTSEIKQETVDELWRLYLSIKDNPDLDDADYHFILTVDVKI